MHMHGYIHTQNSTKHTTYIRLTRRRRGLRCRRRTLLPATAPAPAPRPLAWVPSPTAAAAAAAAASVVSPPAAAPAAVLF